MSQTSPDIASVLREISQLSSALRQGGPDPMDLQELSDALWQATNLANNALSVAFAQRPAGVIQEVAYCGWNPDRGLNFATIADTQQGATSRLMMAGIAGNHGWSVIPLYAALSQSSTGRKNYLPEAIKEYARDLRRNTSGGDDYPWELMRGVADALDEILNYSGGAESSLHDEYVMERARAALSAVTSPVGWGGHLPGKIEP